MEKSYDRETLLVSAEQLKARLGGTGLCIIDTRPAEDYAQGHIPGATHFDLFGLSLIDTSPAPLAAFMFMIHHVLELRGVSQDKEVIFYETDSGMRAARGLWFLEYFGHPNVKMLDGGIRAWQHAGGAVTTDATPPKAARFETAERRDVLATAADVLASVNAGDATILDTRSAGEYFGTHVRAARGGAVPGAVHLEWTENLDASGKFKSNEELKSMYDKAGVRAGREVVTYCQGGYRAAHSYVALRLLGFPTVRNYIGSWKEWGDRTDLPIEQPKQP